MDRRGFIGATGAALGAGALAAPAVLRAETIEWKMTTAFPPGQPFYSTGPGSLTYAESAYEAADGADALVIATEWAEFRRPDLERVRDSMNQPLVFDGRNVFDAKRMAELGFTYSSIGRPSFEAAEVERGATA